MTCTIITTEATDAAGRSHPRMPLALTPDHHDAWLDPHRENADAPRALPTQPADGHLNARPVSKAQAWDSAKETRKPLTVTNPMARWASSNASGIIVSAIMVRIAPAATAVTAAITASEKPPTTV